MRDPEKLKAILAGLCELYGRESVSSSVADLYWQALEFCDDDQVDRAIRRGTKKWECYGRIPSPAQIIREIEGDPEERAMVAWEQLEETIRTKGAWQSVLFTDPKISRVVIALGGWVEVCKWSLDELQYRRIEFLKLYKAAGPCEQKVLAGTTEIANFAAGFDVPKPAIVGDSSVMIDLPKTKRIEFVEHCINIVLTPRKLEQPEEEAD